ncbi:trehalose-phosphatase [Spongisporangium articulatum]|uniref:Trehalose-phosphatase n=1 Tax=Spongisporangium articulatum TaxID=3362603 RepID=A0ABW8ANF1_9ACTN
MTSVDTGDARPPSEPPKNGHHDLIVVANRLPVDRKVAADGTTSWVPSPGGLVTALEPVMQRNAGAWVGWSGSAGEAPEPFEARGIRLIPVMLDEREVEEFYEGMANSTLWPLYHDVVARPQFHRSWWESYEQVNQRFADRAAAEAAPNALVWVQDYQLQLVPQMLRRLRPDLRIGFFNHIPFPPYELFAQLPWRRRVLEGLLGADQLGFQRPADANNFLRACRRNGLSTRRGMVQLPGEPRFGSPDHHPRREVNAAAFPISIDARAVQELAERPEIQMRAKEIRRELGDPRVVLLGVDRLDYTKGILHRLKAVEELFEDGDLEAQDAVLVQVATPSRERVDQYQKMRQDVEVTVGRINGDYGKIGHPAVHYLHQAYGRDELAALYLAADVLLVTALRDGMNLVAKEYVATRYDEGGALVLSEFAGAANELPQAFLINPHDIDGMKAQIMRAVHVTPKEAQRRMRAMRRRVFDHDVARWASTFLKVAASAVEPNAVASVSPGDLPTDTGAIRLPVRPGPRPDVLDRARRALPPGLVDDVEGFAMHPSLLVALDFDGVLAPLTAKPELSRMLPEARSQLGALVHVPGVRLALVSGRSLADLRAIADPPPGTMLVGSHGAEFSDPIGGGAASAELDDDRRALLAKATEELQKLSAQHDRTWVEMKPTGVVLHTRQAEAEVAAAATKAALKGVGSWPGVHVTMGKEVVELSVVEVTKGTALAALRQALGVGAVMYVGDDVTDERAFDVMSVDSGDVSVRVGDGDTLARHRLRDPEQVATLLGLLVDLCRE